MHKTNKKYEAIVIGVSAGGFHTLPIVLKSFPKEFAIPIIIVQHVAQNTDHYFFIQYLSQHTRLNIKEAIDKENILPGNVYIAPPDYHILVELNKTLWFSVDEKINFSRPSIDVLFETAADTYREKLIAILLTGASCDGTKGIKKIKKLKGITIAQAPETCEASTMPQCAIDSGAIDYILKPAEIYAKIISIL